MIVIPALAIPVTVLIRFRPDAVAENTTKIRSPWETGTLSELDAALLNPAPIATVPLKGGVKLIDAAVWVKVLLPAGAMNTVALIVIDDPIRVSASVFLNVAAICVMVPFLGAVKAYSNGNNAVEMLLPTIFIPV